MDTNNFVALDFETATASRGSVCEIGICKVKEGVLQEPLSWYVRPDGNKYDKKNLSVHHISPSNTENAPDFISVWKGEVLKHLEGLPVVAHYASFENSCIQAEYEKVDEFLPTMDLYCSWKMAKEAYDYNSYRLDDLCDKLGIESPVKHRAGEDARRCAELVLRMLKSKPDIFTYALEDHLYKYHDTANYQYLKVAGNNWPFDKQEVSIKEIVGDQSKADPSNYFFGKYVCVMNDPGVYYKEVLWKRIADIGGFPQKSLTQKTNYIILNEGEEKINIIERLNELSEKGCKIEKINIEEFIHRFNSNKPASQYKDKLVYICSGFPYGGGDLSRFLLEEGAIIVNSVTMKTNIVLKGPYSSGNLDRAYRYRDEKGLDIKILDSEEFVKDLSPEIVKEYGFYMERHKRPDFSESGNNMTITLNLGDDGNRSKEAMQHTKSNRGCLGLFIFIIGISTLMSFIIL